MERKKKEEGREEGEQRAKTVKVVPDVN